MNEIPNSVQSESSLVGSLLKTNNQLDKIIDKISVDDFYNENNKLIFSAMLEMSNSNVKIDFVTLIDHMGKSNSLEKIGGESYIYELVKNAISTKNIESYANIIREKSILRNLQSAAYEILEMTFNADSDAYDIVSKSEQKIYEISNKRTSESGLQSMRDINARTLEKMSRVKSGEMLGLSSGFVDLDRITSGFQRSDLIIIAARPSMGKTILGMNIASNIALETNEPVLFFSLEMPECAINMRLFSDMCDIGQNSIRDCNMSELQWDKIAESSTKLSDSKMFIDDSAALTPTQIRSRCRRISSEHGKPALIVIDYLQLMSSGKSDSNRVNEVSHISRSLKAIAKEFDCPVIALSQLNRNLEQRSDRRPIMSDIRESGGIEQDADLILFLYRDEVYNENTEHKGIAELIISKHRNGEIGMIPLKFKGHLMRFENKA